MVRQLDPTTLVSGQIDPSELGDFAVQGVTVVINNRPDHEDPGQPTSAEVEAAARAAGMAYRHVPIARGLGPSHVDDMRQAIESVGSGKALAFCRSGNRSTLAWALVRFEQGVPRDQLIQCAEAAGFSLEPIAHLL